MNRWVYRTSIAILGLLLVFIGSYTYMDSLSSLGSIVFWISILVAGTDLLKSSLKVLRENPTLPVFMLLTSYLALHFIVYSLAIEKLLTSIYGQLFSIGSPFVLISTTPFQGNLLLVALYNLLFNPSLVIGIPPNFYIELSAYATIMGVIIGILVTSIIVKIYKLFGSFRRMKTVFLAPLFGVIGGGSCCISVPLLLSTAIPAANVILISPVGDVALLIAYVMLPPITAAGLALHFNALVPKTPKNLRLNKLGEGNKVK